MWLFMSTNIIYCVIDTYMDNLVGQGERGRIILQNCPVCTVGPQLSKHLCATKNV